jgi:beta-lactamase superfamily II metal-dependent hydrolase
VGLLWTSAASAVVLFWFLKGHWRHTGIWLASIGVAAWLAGDLMLRHRREAQTVLRTDVLAVGDGSCVIMRSAGEAIMWNCGSARVGIGRRTVPDAARALGAWRIPTVVVTSPDLRHLSGLLDVIEPLGVQRVMALPAVTDDARDHPEGAAAFLLRELRRTGVEVVETAADAAIGVGGAAVTHTTQTASGPGRPRRDVYAGLITVGGLPQVAALLAADLDDTALAALLESHPSTRPPLVVLSHGVGAKGNWHPLVTIVSGGQRSASEVPALRPDAVSYSTSLDGAVWAEFDRRGDLRSGSRRSGWLVR